MVELNLFIAGLGNVGSSLVSSLLVNKVFINSKSSINFNIVGISAKNKNKKRAFDISLFEWFDNPKDFIKIKNCDVLIELIGNEKGLSYELVKSALQNKINVVTANKALLANHGEELFEIAEKNNVLLLFEAAVAGGIPIIKTLKNNIFLNRIIKISGILNGTTNYILSKMQEENLDFNEVLLIAKKNGYTSDSEAELDIGGIDSAHKLTLLSTLCFGTKIKFSNNYITGIFDIKIFDIINAKNFGYKIKLISESSVINNQILNVTSPKLINVNDPLANVDGVLNAIKIQTDHLDPLFLEGEGAGGNPTASSVISDLYEIASKNNILSIGYNSKQLVDYKKLDHSEIESSYYIRIMSKDIPGVLSNITGFFERLNISIEKIIQLPNNKNTNSSVVITIFTHLIKKNQLLKVVNQIKSQQFVLEKIIFIPIEKN